MIAAVRNLSQTLEKFMCLLKTLLFVADCDTTDDVFSQHLNFPLSLLSPQ